MQWYALLLLLALIYWVLNVKSLLIFSFTAIISYVFTQNLLENNVELDFANLFGHNGQNNGKRTNVKSFPRKLLGCKQTLIKYILRDFVISWFENVGAEEKFVVEVRNVLEEATDILCVKLQTTNVSSFGSNLCILLHKHLVAFQTAKNELFKNTGISLQTYQSFKRRKLVEENDELEYLRTVVDLLLQKLIKKQTLNCQTGRFILREILTASLLLPVLDTLCDPHFLNTSIINIFGEGSITETPDENPAEYVSSPILDRLEGSSTQRDNKGDVHTKHAESSTEYRFKNTTVIENEYKEIVDISMACGDSKDELELAESLTTDIEQSKSNIESGHAAKEGVLNKDGTCCKSSQKLAKDACGQCNKRQKDLKEKEKDTIFNPLGIFGVRLPPGGFILGRNFGKRINAPSLMKQFGIRDESASTSKLTKGIPVEASTQNEDKQERSSDNCGSSPEVRTSTESDEGTVAKTGNSSGDSRMSFMRVKNDSEPSSFEDLEASDLPYYTKGISPEQKENVEILFHGQYSNMESEVQQKSESSDVITPLISGSKPRLQRLSTSSDEWDMDTFDDLDMESDEFSKSDLVYQDFSDPEEAHDDGGVRSLKQLTVEENPCLLINIPTTELTTDSSWEPHKSKYTVYHIVYSNKLWSKDKKDETDDQTCLIKRRYREFMELHNRLSNGPYASCLKDVPRPNRKFNSPFFRLDEDVVEGRQHLLETYLKGLVTHSNILNCDDLKGFLGIGDESQTTFRRQMIPVPAVPRIDKKLHKKVTKIIDHIKTAFDAGPIEGDREEEFEDINEVLGMDKISQDDIRTFAICSSGCRLSHNCCFAEKCFKSFVQEKLKTVQDINEEARKKIDMKKRVAFSKSLYAKYFQAERKKGSNVLRNGEFITKHPSSFLLTQVIFNLTCELLQDHQSWVCLDPVQEATTTTFACLFEWWFERLVGELVTEEQWQHYLTILKQTVWPAGKLMDYKSDETTDEEKVKVKEEAVQTLSDFFGGILHITIGSDVIKSSVRNIIESLQNKDINRQLLFEVLELTLVELFPEIIQNQEIYLSADDN